MKATLKLTWRTIRAFFGRYIALMLIITLSVGFFSGLKITEDAMANTCDDYLSKQHFYDFRVISTLGFTDDDVDSFSELSFVGLAEGTKSIDAIMEYGDINAPFKLFALPSDVNLPSLTSGRMPASDNECLADDMVFSEDDIGTVIRISDENDESTADQLSGTEFTIVGLANSPIYLGDDRGTTSIGSGAIYGFLFLTADSFTGEIYTEINLTLNETAEIYIDKYDDLIEAHKADITDTTKRLAGERYELLLSETGIPAEMAAQFGLTEPTTYVLTRSENSGYVSFENNTSIISGIANIFPIFFIMIAILVCITTMTRMVDEERTQIGVLKALGFGSGTITSKYLLYAGSATFVGWIFGFFLGTLILPQVFWFAYKFLYDFAPLLYLFSPSLALFTLVVSLIGILGSTLFCCRKELASEPANLIRPRTAKNGKRILLERITPLWKHLKFLQKITLRNMFRYKRRLIMMLVGISCCAGLVVTGFGVRDSMINIGALQFENVQLYDMEAAFTGGLEDSISTKLSEIEEIEDYLICSDVRVDLYGSTTMNSVSLLSFSNTEHLSDFWDFHSGDESLPFPKNNQALISSRIAEKLGLSVGDSFEIENADMEVMTVTVSGIFDNYVSNFVIISADTYSNSFGQWESNAALIFSSGDTDKTARKLTDIDDITSISQLSATKDSVDSALSCLKYIISLVVLFSGALAFIVIFNLTNINLAERSREIATVEVLGFYPNETESYVLNENLVLSVLASFIGLPLGKLFHRIVMKMITVDFMFFDIHITAASYIMAFVCTVFFAVIVNLFMHRQIGKIQMAESLKAVE